MLGNVPIPLSQKIPDGKIVSASVLIGYSDSTDHDRVKGQDRWYGNSSSSPRHDAVKTFSLGLPELYENEIYRGPLLDPADAGIPCPARVHTILVTGDGKVVLAQRSDWRDYNPHTWSFSFEEQLTADPREGTPNRPGSNRPDDSPFDAIVEGAWEEFQLTVDRKSIRLSAIAIELPLYFGDIIAVAHCKELSSQVEACWHGARDVSEHADVRTLEPSLKVLGPLFWNPSLVLGEGAKWHPTSRMRMLAYMAHLYRDQRKVIEYLGKLRPQSRK